MGYVRTARERLDSYSSSRILFHSFYLYFHLRDPTGAIGDVVRGPSRQLECCYSEVYLTRVGRGVVFE